MAFRRTANAIMSKSSVLFDEWMEEIRRQHIGATSKDHVNRVAKTVLRKCDPKQYVLSHSTIVASVDSYAPQGAVTGKRMERGIQVDVRYPDFRIKPECQSLINNNGDAWARPLLLSSYKTFVGAPVYLEHIQIPELSKGFIVDAIARDLGHTCYIDLLTATDRKHSVLVRDILSGAIYGQSMGCISLFTICNKCGNVASDDSQLCPCILYDGKGSNFQDEQGLDNKLAELIGHVSVPNSNQFIEASWVRSPAFEGAVRRNILNPDPEACLSASVGAAVESSRKVYEVRALEPLPNGIAKAASKKRLAQESQEELPEDDSIEDTLDDGADEEPSSSDSGTQDAGSSAPPKSDESGEDKMQGFIDKAQEMLLESLVNSLGDRLAPKPEDVPTATLSLADPGMSSSNLNETLLTGSSFEPRLRSVFASNPSIIDWTLRVRRTILGGRRVISKSSLTPRDLIVFSWIADTVGNMTASPNLYKAAMKVGPITAFPSETSYLAACKTALNRPVSSKEIKFFTRIGRIASVSHKF
jgi:hypothetical protein